MEAVAAYTGLSPAAFFTILAMMVVTYKIVCGMFVEPEDHQSTAASKAVGVPASFRPPAEPVQLGDVKEEQLRAYDGSDPDKPLLMAIKGQIYDVSPGRYLKHSLPQFHCLEEKIAFVLSLWVDFVGS